MKRRVISALSEKVVKHIVFTLLELLDIGIIDRLYNITQKPLGGSLLITEWKARLTKFFGWVGILSVRTTEGEARLLDGIGVLTVGPAEGEPGGESDRGGPVEGDASAVERLRGSEVVI